MRVFLDTNVWASAFGSHGICQDIVELLLAEAEHPIGLITCEQVRAETLRILRDKFRVAPDALAVAQDLLACIETVQPFQCPVMPPDFPDPDDWPILCAAVEIRANLFVTGDKALLALGAVAGMTILDPRAAYLRLRGLA